MRHISLVALVLTACASGASPARPTDDLGDVAAPRGDDGAPRPGPARPDSAPADREMPEPDAAAASDAGATTNTGASRDGAAGDMRAAPVDAVGAADVVATDAKPMRSISAPKGPLCFGADCAGTNPFPGDMDRLRLYNRPLTATEVAAHAKRLYEPCAGDATCVGEWTFDEPAVAGAFASTGDRPLPAKLVGQAALADGPDGKSVRLAGGHVEIANDPSFAVGQAFTYEAWVRRTSCPAAFVGKPPCRFMRMIDLGGSFAIEHHAGGQTMRQPSSGYIGDPWSPTDAWTHVAFVFDARRTTFAFYVGGKASTKLQRW